MLKKRFFNLLVLHKKYILPYWDKYLLIFICSIGFMLFGLIAPFFSKIIVDYALLRNDIVVFKSIIMCSIILFIFSSLIGIIQQYISFYISINVGFKIRVDYYTILCNQSLPFFEKKSTGELIYRVVNDTTNVANLITGTIPNVFFTSFKFLFIVSICIWINWIATFCIFLITPVYYLLNNYFGKKFFKLNKDINEKGQLISDKIQDNLSQIKLYKSFYREKKGINNYKKEAIEQIRILVKNFWLNVLNNQINTILNKCFGVILSVYFGIMVINGKITLGSSVALSFYLIQLADILKSYGVMYQGIVSQFIFVDRFFEIYENDLKMFGIENYSSQFHNGIKSKAIILKNLSFEYSPEKVIFKNVNMEILEGETVVIIGDSGVGKSTLAKLILRLYQPSQGDIYIHNLNIKNVDEKFIRNTCGIVLQEIPIINGTIKENMEFSTKNNVSLKFFTNVAKITEVDSFVKINPSGYDLKIGERGKVLSHGQCQRISIAMSLMKRPKLLILDEATNQIDELMEERIIKNIKKYFPNITLIIISCRTNTLKLANRVFVLKNKTLTLESKLN